MEYVVFAGATLALAFSFPHWEITGRANPCLVGQCRLLGLVGFLAHIGGTLVIAWLSGIDAGIVAFLSIPIAAAVVYSLVVRPISRSRRRKTQRPLQLI